MRYAETSRTGRKARATKRKAGDERTQDVRPTTLGLGCGNWCKHHSVSANKIAGIFQSGVVKEKSGVVKEKSGVVEIGVNTTLFRPIKSPEFFKVVS